MFRYLKMLYMYMCIRQLISGSREKCYTIENLQDSIKQKVHIYYFHK